MTAATSTPATVAAVIPTRNVAAVIGPTLDSLRFCDEVIVVDMFSTDGTRGVCESYPNVRFLQRQDYIFGNFNFGVEQARSQWIIRLDSDEVLSAALQQSILGVLNTPSVSADHFDAECHLYICGIRLRGGYGDCWRTTLFRRGTARYPVAGEHEALTVSGEGGRLQGHYDHFSVATLSQWMTKYNYYTDKDVERMPMRPPKPWWKVLWHTANHFRGSFFGKGNLRRDGYLGFTVAMLAAFAQVLLEVKIWEKYERHRLQQLGQLPDHPNARPSSPVERGAARLTA